MLRNGHNFKLIIVIAMLAIRGFSGGDSFATGDLLDTLLKQNESGREKIKSVSYTMERTVTLNENGEERKISGTAEVKKQGEYESSIYKSIELDKKSGKQRENESRVVLNDKYFAYLPMRSNPTAYRVDHSSNDSMAENIKTKHKNYGPSDEFFSCCFGEPRSTLRQMVLKAKTSKNIRYDAVEAKADNGELVYHVRRFMKNYMKNDNQPQTVWVINPAKGCLVAAATAFNPDGSIWISRTIRAEIFDGTWFPVEFDQKKYQQSKDSTEKNDLISWEHTLIKNVKLNNAISENEFSLESMKLNELNPHIRVQRTGLDGIKTVYLFRDGKLVPEDMAHSISRIEKKVTKKAADDIALKKVRQGDADLTISISKMNTSKASALNNSTATSHRGWPLPIFLGLFIAAVFGGTWKYVLLRKKDKY